MADAGRHDRDRSAHRRRSRSRSFSPGHGGSHRGVPRAQVHDRDVDVKDWRIDDKLGRESHRREKVGSWNCLIRHLRE